LELKYLLEKYEALGTYWYIKYEDPIEDSLVTKIQEDLKTEIATFEHNYSRFKDSSELSKLNKLKYLNNSSADLLQMLELSLDYNKATGNYFNIAVGGELSKLGYSSKFSFDQTGDRVKIPYLDKIIQISANGEVTLAKEFNLDLGGIGKSYLINKIKNKLEGYGLKKFLINVGGDIYTSYPQDIYIQNPVNTTKYLSKILVSKGGIATSTPILRSWIVNDKKHHHLINPNETTTKLNYLSSTVICDDIITADIWSKVILLSNAQVEISLNDINVYLIDADFNVLHLG